MALNWVEIDLAALRHNFAQVQHCVGSRTAILAVVKSDAYGHGMIPVARELAKAGAHFFGVSKCWEALKLRSAGIRQPIVVLAGMEAEDAPTVIAYDLRPAVYRLDHCRLLDEAAQHAGKVARIHLKLDTGMGRLGVPVRDLEPFLDQMASLKHVHVEGVFSHLATADEADKTFSKEQMARFRGALQRLHDRSITFEYAHIANSGAVLDIPEAHGQLVRAGIMLYGSPPSEDIQSPVHLRPVMALKTKILQVKWVPSGHSIGYGRTFVCSRPTRIATIAVGYDDGYPRALSNRGEALVHGVRVPIVGRVSMNLITLDVTHVPGAAPDDEVVLLGTQGTERISAEEIAQKAHTISYEIYCAIGKNPQRLFLNSSGHLA
ncbi:alanine racemase [Desulfosoma caldarium]|uniref:Alanine racemase n=1 Tax=Desulfosoma caldarium TaxID=610254 RepID=A0A3N1UQ71_9BACT|nr:alanine racemase [Desulfosoma caldarium]ROQ92213.1 alanine racemase [Desulfosoma caldarium]